MAKYLLGKLAQSLLAIAAATLVVFLLSRATGDPTALLVPPDASVADAARVREAFGLDRSLPEQYLLFIVNALQGDFGTSIQYRVPAVDILTSRLPATAALALLAFACTVAITIPAGIYAAARRGGRFDWTVRSTAAASQAVPNFWLATILILVFSVYLGVVPTSGNRDWTSYILPVATMTFFALAGLTRITRSSMLETLGTEYVKFARTKGASENAVLWKHSLRNASLPILTYGALVLIGLLSGSVIIETVFGWPGIGQAVVQAVSQRDFPVVQVIVLFFSVLYIVGNFIVDVCYALLNPRIRYS